MENNSELQDLSVFRPITKEIIKLFSEANFLMKSHIKLSENDKTKYEIALMK